MGQSLKEVIDLLYKPPQGQRQAIAVSRRVAEQLPPLPTVAMISITAPERAHAEVDGFTHLLRLSFEDVDHLNTDISARAKAKIKDAFTVQQAKEIHAFVQALPAEICTLIVHCEGGYSRSCAVVLSLHNIYGFCVNTGSLVQANPSVVKTMIMSASKR
ncbi:hypothetical protein N5F13_12040 [Comamonas thiooxydans]|uniref:Tyrosine specific protein phosphatases domain-containing protein n=1 Tax=Comamonas thiooxydans TaxID=363952 RepID=A0A0E3B7F8_9BURK|nr:hypothetical protein [Comamonas thiooxydans]KGG83653.1 hypothetical protein P245_25070 [Comamonas thiooxydans]MDH1475231.1 hypothetical protein [Comamonas thiooxydans]